MLTLLILSPGKNNVARRINTCLNPILAKVCQQAIQLEGLKEKIAAFLPAPLKSQVQVASFNKGTLNLLVSNATWAASLRYLLPELRDQLRSKAGLYQLIALKISVELPKQKQITQAIKKPKLLSSKACLNIKDSVKELSYSPLKEALLKLTRHE